MDSAHFYAALTVHLQLQRRHAQRGKIPDISSAAGDK